MVLEWYFEHRSLVKSLSEYNNTLPVPKPNIFRYKKRSGARGTKVWFRSVAENAEPLKEPLWKISLGMIAMIPTLLKDVLDRFIYERPLENHAHSIALDEYALKTYSDARKVDLDVENDHFRDPGFIFFSSARVGQSSKYC